MKDIRHIPLKTRLVMWQKGIHTSD